MHDFFKEIENFPILKNNCLTSNQKLPEPYIGKDKIKAILLGADPTNNGIRKYPGPKVLDKVFGFGSFYESYFFKIHETNLKAIGIEKDNCYIQNLCRNYFTSQTSKNQYWHQAAEIWKKYLKQDLDKELGKNGKNIPILATCGEVFQSLTGIKGPYTNIYSLKTNPDFYSEDLGRQVLPLFRGRSYIFYKDKWMDYRTHLKNILANE